MEAEFGRGITIWSKKAVFLRRTVVYMNNRGQPEHVQTREFGGFQDYRFKKLCSSVSAISRDVRYLRPSCLTLKNRWGNRLNSIELIDFLGEILKIVKVNCNPVLRKSPGLRRRSRNSFVSCRALPKSDPPPSAKRLQSTTRAARPSRARAISVYRLPFQF
jgi:hypothetical protein